MAVPRDIEARRYYRVALQRLDEGALILEKLDLPRASMYLTGYAVECMLKAWLITATPARHREQEVRLLRAGARTHDINWLRQRLDAKGVPLPPERDEQLLYLSMWSTELRYQPGAGDREDSRRFVDTTRDFLAWACERL